VRRVLLRSSGRRARKAAQPTVSLAARQVKSLEPQRVQGFFLFVFMFESGQKFAFWFLFGLWLSAKTESENPGSVFCPHRLKKQERIICSCFALIFVAE